MPRYSIDELRHIFTNSTDFNDLFEAFQDALEQKIREVDLYRLLFWNNALSPDELCLFGEKLASEFPEIAYDNIDVVRGMDVIVTTTAKTDEEARALLALFGFPFPKEEQAEEKEAA